MSIKRGADFGGRGGLQQNHSSNGLKRFRGPSGGFDEDPSKECRILIPARYKANVTIPDSSAPERIVCVSGELETMIEVANDVLGKLEESRQKDGADEKEAELKILVHKNAAGAVIGKGGAKIKEMRETTKSNVKVFPNPCPMSTDRVVGIAGARESQILALREVLKAVSEATIKGSTMQYDTDNYDGVNVGEYGGYPPDRNWRGPPGGSGPRPGMQMGGVGGRGGYGGGSLGMNRGPGGPQSGYGSGIGQYMGNTGGGMNMGPSGGQGRSMGPGGGGMNLGMGPSGRNMGGMGIGQSAQGRSMGYGGGSDGGQMQTSRVTIPKEMAGTIIGRGGERLKSIKDESGAHVMIEPLEQGANDRVITIKGTPQCIQTAQFLLQEW